MNPMDDWQLLREYARRNSEDAFRTLVERYAGLVYHAALRQSGNPQTAQDITQAVFIALARKADRLPRGTVLSGWLFRATRFAFANIAREESRRQRREQEAVMMQNPLQPDESESVWKQITPLLDDALDHISAKDREALLLRFFQDKPHRETAWLLGISEDAAKVRVSRAVEKLRLIFATRGVAVPSVMLLAAFAAHGTQAAPAGLTAAIASAAAAKGTVGVSSTLTIAKGVLKIMAWTKAKTAIVVGAGVLIAAGTAVESVVKYAQYRAAHAPITEKRILQGLVLHLTFDQVEAGGAVADDSGRGNNGQATGVRWTPDGKKGGAYEFTRDGDQILVPNNPSLNPGQFTLSAWIKTTTGDHYWRRIFDKSYSEEFALSVAGDYQNNKSYGQVSFEIGPGTHFALTKKRVDDGQWHQVTATFDGTNEVIYVDGKAEVQKQWDGTDKAGSSDFDLVIGCNRSNIAKSEDDLGVSFRGLIDEPMMWNRALSPAEVAYLFQSSGIGDGVQSKNDP
jgi:RNA polymerase sigma factor (sigma-70 family)